ncbi:MAG: glycosyltransferase [Luteitalea sp.]|nr:glycosyltransferase [Luteitalea sp.]
MFADRGDAAIACGDGRRQVIPCWTFGSPLLAASVIRAARPLKLDALWFNLHMTSAGNTKASWFGGVCAPAIARAAGFKVIVTLHNMLGMTDLGESGVDARPWDVAAAHVATRSLGYANAVCTLRPEYVSLLASRYRMRNVFYMPHGTLGPPVDSPPRNDGTRILAFGHFGSYKRLEPLIEAVGTLSRAGNPIRLTIGGTDSRHSPGYLAGLERRHRSMANLEFLGYVAEQDVPALFESAALCVLPYATMAGMSGVAILAAMHGVPIVASDILAFRALERDGLRMRRFKWPDPGSLAETILTLLSAPDERCRLARENLSFAHAQRMSSVAGSYVDLIEAVVSGATIPRPGNAGSCWRTGPEPRKGL